MPTVQPLLLLELSGVVRDNLPHAPTPQRTPSIMDSGAREGMESALHTNLLLLGIDAMRCPVRL